MLEKKKLMGLKFVKDALPEINDALIVQMIHEKLKGVVKHIPEFLKGEAGEYFSIDFHIYESWNDGGSVHDKRCVDIFLVRAKKDLTPPL